MKKGFLIIIFSGIVNFVLSQDISTNRYSVSLEHNVLFNAVERYVVTQKGKAVLDLNKLFDGRMGPSYSSVGVDSNDPTIIEIANLPAWHVQAGAWFGWSTRWYMPTRFLLEGYDVHQNKNQWRILSDYRGKDYTGLYSQIVRLPFGTFTKFRLTIYKTNGAEGRLGLSELFYIHPEIGRPYSGLLQTMKNNWKNEGKNIYYLEGNVGIGTTLTGSHKLAVEGSIGAREIKVEANGWSDFVFEPNYELKDLESVEKFVKENKHLPEIPSKREVEANGVDLGKMNSKLLQKIEELTLHLIDVNKRLKYLEENNKQNHKRK